jgi:hypothetical protein
LRDITRIPQIIAQLTGDNPHWQAAVTHLHRDIPIDRSTFEGRHRLDTPIVLMLNPSKAQRWR